MGWPLQRVEKREEDMLGIRPKERDREDLWQGALWVKDERKKSREASLQMPLLEQRVLQVKYNHNPIRVVSLLQIGHKGLIQRARLSYEFRIDRMVGYAGIKRVYGACIDTIFSIIRSTVHKQAVGSTHLDIKRE
ncbi:hypothetical protein M0R45_022045 [Rubus argutus]|uniref:Uncharacterized protein n=1 Tax=Rubus argutus TaxID=59490 RepID=A0AAW1XFN2_RUBAR